MSTPQKTEILPGRRERLPIIGNNEFGLTVETVERVIRQIQASIDKLEKDKDEMSLTAGARQIHQQRIEQLEHRKRLLTERPDVAVSVCRQAYDFIKEMAICSSDRKTIAEALIESSPEIINYLELLNEVPWGRDLVLLIPQSRYTNH